MYIGCMEDDMQTPSLEAGANHTKCAHANVIRGRSYDYCDDCGAVRRAATTGHEADPWHSCPACRTMR